jgi:DNA repair protein RecO (recombination protein O)
MESCSADAILLSVTDYGEADRLVTLFTLEQGKLRGIAKGARKSIRRFGGCLEPFARLSVQLTVTSGLVRLAGADAVTIHTGIRKDLLKIGYAGYACEVVDLFLPEGFANPRLFRLLTAYLERLDSHPPVMSDRRFFEINLLNIMGYRPELSRCAACGCELSGSLQYFAGTTGQLYCSRCDRGGRRVSPTTITQLTAALRIGRFGALTLSLTELNEAGFILDPALAIHVARPFKSLAFLKEIGV